MRFFDFEIYSIGNENQLGYIDSQAIDLALDNTIGKLE
jgi:hypothetical protein